MTLVGVLIACLLLPACSGISNLLQPDPPDPTPVTAGVEPGAASPSPTQGTERLAAWPDATNTGVAGCPPLEKVENGDQVVLQEDGAVYENKELVNEAVIRVLAHHVTIRCVKMTGTGYFGIDNSDLKDAVGPDDTTVDRVEISCRDKGQVIGILLKHGTVSRADVHNCDHMVNAGGDQLTVRDSYCHDLTDKEVVHADCIQTLGGATGLTIQHNSLWSRDTSDILLGQEYGDAKDVLIDGNRLMSIGDPPPAFLLYVSGLSTTVTNNRFTRRYTYGPCTLNTAAEHITWEGNVWDDDGSELRLSDCK